MICTTCFGMLRGQDGRQWRGTFDLFFDHHTFRWELERSAEIGCCICRTVWHGWKKIEHTEETLRLEHRDVRVKGAFIRAFLSELHEKRGLYQIDFKLSDSRRLGTFLLKQKPDVSQSQIYTPISSHTSSDEVLQLARYWLRRCISPDHGSCPDESWHKQKEFYPTRLIDLWADEEVETKKREKENPVLTHRRSNVQEPCSLRDPKRAPAYVRLIVTRVPKLQTSESGSQENHDQEEQKSPEGDAHSLHYQPQVTKAEGPYVTLSHCWGGKVFTRLLKKLLPSFQKKLPLNELPRTFRDAIHFTRRLNSDIRYIWIDSLCIVQDDDEDWNSEAAQMYEVYTNSYCNISATAAKNSEEGLFFSRSPQQLWGDEINLNTEGIPKARTRELGNQTLGHEPLIRRCDILDMSFWEREVDKAPVNVRGWVLQERLLPPRVLHFCKHQIAWECRCLDAAEQFAHGVPSMGLQVGNVEQRSSLKSLLPDIHSRRPVSSILSEVSDAAHERWKKVVERFLKTGLTKEKDKLIALAGIAELMSNQIRGRYIAGMWEKYLPSQLLWYVEPVYDNGLLSYPSRRPAYRAPSFSWASIDATQGIRCGETVRQDDLHIVVQNFDVTSKGQTKFGEVADGYVGIVGVMTKVKIERREKKRSSIDVRLEKQGTTRYVWYAVNSISCDDGDEEKAIQAGAHHRKPGKTALREHDIVYLDSPSDDFEDISSGEAQLYCVPVYTDASDYLICLLLLFERCILPDEIRCFRRVGLAVVPPYEDGQDTILPIESDGRRRRTEYFRLV